jgi:MYXO-CTERM domain-containing protein
MHRSGFVGIRGPILAASLAVTLLAVGTAAASVSNYALRVGASNASGSGSVDIPLSDLEFVPALNRYRWTQGLAEDIFDESSGRFIARLDSSTGFYAGDPQVNLGFAVTAGSSLTTFTISSGLLSFAPIDSSVAIGRASAALTVTDSDFNGTAELVGTGPSSLGPRAYRANYNGSTQFSALLTSVIAPPGGSGSMSDNDPPLGDRSVGATASDMGVVLQFTVTPSDQGSGTTNYRITPEPAALAALAIGGLALLRRR